MGQRTPIKKADATPRLREVLSWAQLASLVEIHPDGSWNLTELGMPACGSCKAGHTPTSRPTSVRTRLASRTAWHSTLDSRSALRLAGMTGRVRNRYVVIPAERQRR